MNYATADGMIYRRTSAGASALANPQGRVSRGFLRLLALIDGSRTLADLREAVPNLSASDIQTWARELARQGLIALGSGSAAAAATLSSAAPAKSYEYEGALEMEKDDAFNQTVEQVRQALKRTQPQAEDHLLKTTARLVVLESDATTRTIDEKGFFAFPSRAAETPGRSQAGDFLVLIVEDDPLQAHMTQTIVAQEGYRTDIAADGNELLARLRAEQKPDLILMDVELPGGDGFDFLDKMRKHPYYEKMRVIMLTGRSDRADIARGVMLGANGYVTKPFRPELLRGAIRQTLNLA